MPVVAAGVTGFGPRSGQYVWFIGRERSEIRGLCVGEVGFGCTGLAVGGHRPGLLPRSAVLGQGAGSRGSSQKSPHDFYVGSKVAQISVQPLEHLRAIDEEGRANEGVGLLPGREDLCNVGRRVRADSCESPGEALLALQSHRCQTEGAEGHALGPERPEVQLFREQSVTDQSPFGGRRASSEAS
jgi:hypothetical protein